MPAPPADEPITKVTLNLWSADVAFLKKEIGDRWSVVVRDWVRRAVRAKKAERKANAK